MRQRKHRSDQPSASKAKLTLNELCQGAELRSVVRRNGATIGLPGAVVRALDASILFARASQHDNARAAFKLALKKFRAYRGPMHNTFRFRIFCGGAYLAYCQGKMARAEQISRAAILLTKRLPPSVRRPARHLASDNLARVLERTERRGKALEIRERCFSEDPTSVNALRLAFAYHDAGLADRVLAILGSTSAQYEPGDAAGLELLRAAAHVRLNQRASANEALKRYKKLAHKYELEEIVN